MSDSAERSDLLLGTARDAPLSKEELALVASHLNVRGEGSALSHERSEESNGLCILSIIIKKSADELYIGTTDDPKRRLSEHNTGRDAHFTKHPPTYQIVFLKEDTSGSDARKREVQLKKW